MSFELTDAQREAVEWRGSSLLLTASAGSGKTEVLARHCAELIADAQRPVEVDRLLVVTFTRAAASELRARVARMLQSRLRGTHDARLRRHLQRQIVLIDAADIGTIDSWCGRLVRSHYVEAGVDPAFAVLSEEQASLLRAEVLESTFEWMYSSDDEAARRGRDWVKAAARPSDRLLREMVLALNRFREHLIAPAPWFARQRAAAELSGERWREYAEGVVADGLRGDFEFVAKQAPDMVRPLGDRRAIEGVESLRMQLMEWAERLRRPRGLEQVLEQLADYRMRLPPRLEATDRRIFEEVRKHWLQRNLQDRWRLERVRSAIAKDSAAPLRLQTLLDLEERYARELAAAKAGRAAYEFGDVLRMALDLLGESDEEGRLRPTPVAERLRRRYEFVLVDEYQDTSPLQVALLHLVARERPGNRFLVGDVKQSIYGFREAEPRLFVEQIDAFDQQREHGEARPLSDNFRSHAGVLAAINEMFAALFDPVLGGTEYGPAERLRARRGEIANPTLDDAPRAIVRVLPQRRRGASDGEDDDGELLEQIEREGCLIAAEIRDLLERSVRIPRRDANNELRLSPLRLSDIVVLLRSAKGNAPLLSHMLRREGVPNVAVGRESMLDCTEVGDVRTVLRLLVNREHDLTWAAFLRGPFVGLDERDLSEIRVAARHGGFADAVLRCVRDGGVDCAGALRAAVARLDHWASLACEVELPVLLRAILRDGMLLEFAQALPGGDHRVAMLHAFEALAAEFAERGEHGVGEFVEHLDQMDAGDVRPAAAAAVDEDVVRVMTIHASKGLEFPIVFLAGAGASLNRSGSGRTPLLCDESLGIGFCLRDATTRTECVTPAYMRLAAAARRREREEELRLLYVAATRARERLYVVGHAPEDLWEQRRSSGRSDRPPPLSTRLVARSMLDWVLIGAAGVDESVIEVRVGEPPTPGTRRRAAAETTESAAPPAGEAELWIDRAARYILRSPDDTGAAVPSAVSVSVLKQQAYAGEDRLLSPLVAAPSLDVPAFARESPESDGRARGTAYHRFLEHARLDALRTADDVRRWIQALVESGRLADEQAQLLDVDDLTWLANGEWAALTTAEGARLRREVPFAYALRVPGVAEPVLLRGVIDALVETPDGLHLADYKTDRPRDAADRAERISRYSAQLQLYALAAGAIFRRPVVSARLVLLPERATIEVPIDARALNAVGQTLVETLVSGPRSHD